MVDLEFFVCIVLGLLFNIIMYLVMGFLQFMAVCLKVNLQASILVVCPMLTSSLIHCCIAKISCVVDGRMIFVRACSCCMSRCIIQVG